MTVALAPPPVAVPAVRLGDAIERAAEAAAIALLLATTAIALLQVFCRYVLGGALAWPEEAIKFLFVWFVFVGAAMVTRRGQHIAIDMLQRSLPGRWLPWHAAFARTVSAAASGFLLIYGWQLTRAASFVSPALEWPHTYLYLAVPVGAALALLLKLLTPVAGMRGLVPAALAVAAGLGIAGALAWMGDQGLFGFPQSIAAALVLLVIGLMMLGVPLVDALVFGTCAAFLPRGPLLMTSVPQGMVNGMDYLLVAIPFFILAAGFMNAGGITDRLVALAVSLVGHFRGGFGHVNVLTNTLMGGVSGSSTADAAAIAKTLVLPMAAQGYPKPFSVALTASASILANLIPPSLGLIVYASLAAVSVGALFVGTIVPGLLMAAALSIVVWLSCRRHGYGPAGRRATWAERGIATKLALPALALPLLIVGGIRYGAFSATEAGAVAALYSLLCGVLVYRNAGGRQLLQATRAALSETVTVMIVIAASAPFAYALVIEQVPQRIALQLGTLAGSALVLLLVINVFLIVVGLAMEMIASMVILVPLLVPLLKAANVDLVHFGIVMVANLCIGALTPPLAVLVFTAARVTDTPVPDTYRACRPFMAALLVWLALVTFVPALTLWPVRFFG
ncbi:MAG: TRAP transporter large permease subunit [Burkholderiales bacterium]|nr:TRAP transporter large permease subunit [Burkholderiales bacterium]